MVYRSEREEVTLEEVRDLLEAIKDVDGIKKIVDAIDISDREARKLGEVKRIVDAIDVSDRETRKLGEIKKIVDAIDVLDRAARKLGIVYGSAGVAFKQKTAGELLINPVFEPDGAELYLEGTASPTVAGEVTIGSYTPEVDEVVSIMEVIGGGSIDGYVTIYWDRAVKWRGRFLAGTSVGEQFKVPKKVVGDGTKVLSLKVYASAAGDVEAFLNGVKYS